MVGAHLNCTPKPFIPPTPIPFNSLPFNPIIPALAHISYLPLGKLLHLSKLVSSSVKWGWGSYTHRKVVRVKPNSLCRALSVCVLRVTTILALSSPHLSLSFTFLVFPLLLATPCVHQVCPPGGHIHCSSCPAIPALEGSQPLISLPPLFPWWQLCHLSTSAPSSSQISWPLVCNSSFIPQIFFEHLLYARLCARCWGNKKKDQVSSMVKECTVYTDTVERSRGRGSPDLDLGVGRRESDCPLEPDL